ncbi:unnamed protein product [Didymodactylos carnosus]|uniref:Uncharacterized protein n=1 Tax=Didymodactylos carnosus TaxID=1234261 RepID=A0A813ZMH9_9BILA|nr:unnamed protein product [Didymodactylos carnosus]CAF0900017.1 unnamed protein product [Didymodactylos carnosus]CAF3548167.1 unnamed protein product [Didymodactylos carnosus]CAF3682644.1 unnamed protein product [Didymodactylos carnosus]
MTAKGITKRNQQYFVVPSDRFSKAIEQLAKSAEENKFYHGSDTERSDQTDINRLENASLPNNIDDDQDSVAYGDDTLSASSDNTSDITNVMKENEKKIRALSESYMNRFVMLEQQLQEHQQMPRRLTHMDSIQITTKNSQLQLSNQLIQCTKINDTAINKKNEFSSESLDTFLNSLQEIILREEKKREKSYFTNDHTREINLSSMIVAVAQCLKDYEGELYHAKQRINYLKDQQEHILNENKQLLNNLTQDFEQNIINVRHSYDQRLNVQREETTKIMQTLEKSKTDLTTLQENYEKKLRVKDELLREMNDRFGNREKEYNVHQQNLQIKFEQFEKSFETLQNQNRQIDNSNKQLIKEKHDLQLQISALHNDLQRSQNAFILQSKDYSELSQKLTAACDRLSECEQYQNQLKHWFSLVSPEHILSKFSLEEMTSIVSLKVSRLMDVSKQYEMIISIMGDDDKTSNLLNPMPLHMRIKELIKTNDQLFQSYSEISNKYNALLLQTTMLTDIIKQHSSETANLRAENEQYCETNANLIGQTEKMKNELQNIQLKFSEKTTVSAHVEHELNMEKQHYNELKKHYETALTDKEILIKELQTRRETIVQYEKEEKDDMNQQLIKLNAVLKSQVKQNGLSDGDKYRELNDRTSKVRPSNDEILPIRATSTPTPSYLDHEIQPSDNNNVVQQLVLEKQLNTESDIYNPYVTKQINQVLYEMKNLLSSSRAVIQQDILPVKDNQPTDRNHQLHKSLKHKPHQQK